MSKWSAFGHILLKTIPLALMGAEAQHLPGPQKRELYHQMLVEAVGEIAANPKVKDKLEKAADALVEVQNVLNQVHTDQAKGVPSEAGKLTPPSPK